MNSSSWKVQLKTDHFLMNKSCCIHNELHKFFKFQGQFDLDGKGQGHQFSNPPEIFGCSIKQFKVGGKIQNSSIFKVKTKILEA